MTWKIKKDGWREWADSERNGRRRRRRRGVEYLDADVEGDGDDRVEDDGVREEDEEGDDGGAAHRLVGDQRVPRQEGSKGLARDRLPDAAGRRAEQAHGQQEKNNLETNRSVRQHPPHDQWKGRGKKGAELRRG